LENAVTSCYRTQAIWHKIWANPACFPESKPLQGCQSGSNHTSHSWSR